MNYQQAIDYARTHIDDPTLPNETRRALAQLVGRIRRIDVYERAEQEHISAEEARLLSSKPTFDEIAQTIDDEMNSQAMRVERAVLIICANKPIPVVAAAIHALVCQDEKLRKFLHALDIVCKHQTQQILRAAGSS